MSHLDDGSEPAPRFPRFDSMGADPILEPPPPRKVKLTLPVIGTVIALIEDVIEPTGPTLNEVIAQGREWAMTGLREATDPTRVGNFWKGSPNVNDPLAVCSQVVRDCPYSRQHDPSFFAAWCRGAIDHQQYLALDLVRHKHAHDPCPHHSADATYSWVVELRAKHKAALDALDRKAPLVAQIDLIKVLESSANFGQMPDVLWERALSGKPPHDVPVYEPHVLWNLRFTAKDAESAKSDDKALRARYVPQMKVVDGKEVPDKDADQVSWYQPDPAEIEKARKQWAEYEAAVAEHDRLLYTYFRTWHWARGIYLAAQDLLQLDAQAARQAAQRVADESPEVLTKWEVDQRALWAESPYKKGDKVRILRDLIAGLEVAGQTGEVVGCGRDASGFHFQIRVGTEHSNMECGGIPADAIEKVTP